MFRNFGIIYALIECDTREIRYIGQTTQPIQKRLKQHFWQSTKQKNHLGYWLLNNKTNVKIKILKYVDISQLNDFEIMYINKYNNLVNSMKGCERSKHYRHTAETKLKISIKSTLNQLGVRKSEECKRNISLAHMGKKVSRESVLRGIENRKWYKPSEETRMKLKIANTGKIRTELSKAKMSIVSKKKIYVYDILNKSVLTTCIKDFSKELKLAPNSISDRLNRYPDRIYRNNYLLSRNEEGLSRLMKQLGII